MKLVHPVLLIALLVTVSIQVAHTINNGLALTPIMGFNTWNQFGHHPNETLLKKTMDNMVKLGLRDIGYKYILIDDCWALSERDHDTQRMVPNPDYFPNGMRHLSNYAHERGLLLGIYTDIGKKTCCYKEEKPGSYEYYDIDAQTYADWNIDYVKVDFCAATKEQGEQPDKFYNFMSEALNKTGRPMVYSICNWGYKAPWTWAPKMSNLWRTTADIHANWREVMRNTDINRRYAKYAKPGEWNDPDLLVVGVKQGTSELNFIQSRTHFSLWAIMASPLILGNDFRVPEQIDPQILEIIMNKDVIAVNQDPLGVQGVVVDESIIGVNMSSGSCQYQPCVRTEVWVKPLERERFSVLLFNRAGMDPEGKGFRHERITLDWVKHLNVSASQEYLVKDLWQNKIYGVYKGQFTSDVLQVQDASMLTLTPV